MRHLKFLQKPEITHMAISHAEVKTTPTYRTFESDYALECVNLKKEYPGPKGSFVVLENFNMSVKDQEFVTIIGHSGCGKSTVLSMIAGLIPITKGNIVVNKHEIMGPGPDRAVVFQSPSLFPWMTAYENVLLGVKRVFPHVSKGERENLCCYFLEKVGLADAMDKKVAELSSGMKQRVGIARAFALKPNILLLDEPFGMLDSLTRFDLQETLMEVWSREKITAVMVTHDIDEALFLSDRVIMMTGGPYAKVGDTLDIRFDRPRVRQDVLKHLDYYNKRSHLMDFLEE